MGVYQVKQLIIIRKDLGMNKGKLAAQAAHASMGAFLKAFEDATEDLKVDDGTFFVKAYTLENEVVDEWLKGSFAKVALAVNSEEELKACYDLAIEHNLLSAYIEDNGTTVFNGVKTPTCVGIGPEKSEVLDKLFGHLKLY